MLLDGEIAVLGLLPSFPCNLCVTPSGGILLFCEDDAGSADTATDIHPLAPGVTDVNRLIGLTREGVPFTFAVNRLNDCEFAGSCFSPDGDILFVNVFGTDAPGSGMTCAIANERGRSKISQRLFGTETTNERGRSKG